MSEEWEKLYDITSAFDAYLTKKIMKADKEKKFDIEMALRGVQSDFVERFDEAFDSIHQLQNQIKEYRQWLNLQKEDRDRITIGSAIIEFERVFGKLTVTDKEGANVEGDSV
jgi:hypothetical protein